MYIKEKNDNNYTDNLRKSKILIDVLKQADIIMEDDSIVKPMYNGSGCIIRIKDKFSLDFIIQATFEKDVLKTLNSYKFTGRYFTKEEPSKNGFLISFRKDKENKDNFILRLNDMSWNFSLRDDKLGFTLKEKVYKDENKKTLEARK